MTERLEEATISTKNTYRTEFARMSSRNLISAAKHVDGAERNELYALIDELRNRYEIAVTQLGKF